MTDNRWKVFIDTNVFIAGLASSTGASAAILDLGEAEEILIVISQHILIEANRVFLLKFPQLANRFRVFIKNLSPLLINDPSPANIREAASVIELDDAPILAAVKNHTLDYLITLDTKHFKTPQVRQFVSMPILTPSEFLTEFRRFWEKQNS